MNIYWVTTPDGDENWFVIAPTKCEAEIFHESAEGYNENYANAKLVSEIPKKICTKFKLSSNKANWPPMDLLETLGAKILSKSNPRIINVNGKVYKEGNFTERIFQREYNNHSGVYVVTEQNTKHFKIGCTTNLNKRLQEIRISSPHNIKLVYFVVTVHYRSLENLLHKIFKVCRGRGGMV